METFTESKRQEQASRSENAQMALSHSPGLGQITSASALTSPLHKEKDDNIVHIAGRL